MFGFEENSDCKEEPTKAFDEFVSKRENDRIKLHARYICFIATAIVVWLITTGTANDPNFPVWVSFASTITSIILSVLAIIMSITGEGKTEHIKEQLEATAKDIKKSQENVNEINKSIKENLGQLNLEVKRLSDKVDEVPNKTAQQVTTYQNEKMRNDAANRNINTRVSLNSWGNSKQ